VEEASVPAAWGRFDELMMLIAACRDDEQTYWLGSDVSSRDCLGSSDAMVASTDVTHGYLIWAALTDRWELKPVEQAEAARAMREAASEWLTVKDDTTTRRAYLDRWMYEICGYKRDNPEAG
jgi:hypothetical protein